MARVVQVWLMIGGIVACPLVCMKGGECCSPSAACRDCAQDRTRGQDSPAACTPKPCCQEPCADREDAGKPDRAPGPCQPHGCVCNGALEARHGAEWDVDSTFFIPSSDVAAFHLADCTGLELLSRYRHEPSFPHLESGRALRLVLESLLL